MRLPYYWVWKVHRGQLVIRGPYRDETEANIRGIEELQGDFETVKLLTLNADTARGLIKEIALQKGYDLDLVLRRVKHQPLGDSDGLLEDFGEDQVDKID